MADFNSHPKRWVTALGKYTAIEYNESGRHGKENIRNLMSKSEIASFMDAYSNGLFYIPVLGQFPFKMKRAHYDSNFWEHKRWVKKLWESDFFVIRKIKDSLRGLKKGRA